MMMQIGSMYQRLLIEQLKMLFQIIFTNRLQNTRKSLQFFSKKDTVFLKKGHHFSQKSTSVISKNGYRFSQKSLSIFSKKDIVYLKKGHRLSQKSTSVISKYDIGYLKKGIDKINSVTGFCQKTVPEISKTLICFPKK